LIVAYSEKWQSRAKRRSGKPLSLRYYGRVLTWFLKCEIVGIESELSAGHPIPANFVRGSNKGPKLGLFAAISGVSLL
jgi:hypothetical protein